MALRDLSAADFRGFRYFGLESLDAQARDDEEYLMRRAASEGGVEGSDPPRRRYAPLRGAVVQYWAEELGLRP